MSRPAQLPLGFEHRPALGGADFLVTAGNSDAVAWVDRWPDWPAPALVVHGPQGCGKSHLAQVLLARSGGRLVGVDALASAPATAFDDPPSAFVIDGLEAALARGLERAVLHLYNAAAEAGRRILITARQSPARLDIALADLASRLRAAPAVAIGLPDDTVVTALLVKLFADRQLRVGADVVGYIATRIERSFAAVERVVAAVDTAALANRRNVTVPLVRDVLAGLGDGSFDGPATLR
ncbi:MAG: DNA replication protein [Rhodospirillales bacterium]|nr:DNA replication protein [Rhodospirillales bacterium]